MAIGITSFIIFVFGVILLLKSGEDTQIYEEPVFTENDDVLAQERPSPLTQSIEFANIEGEVPITTTPDPVPMGEVVLGTDAKNVLTVGTNGKVAIRITSVELADPPADGFTFQDQCSGKSLSGKETCNISMSWMPIVAGNVQNNFLIVWHELSLSSANSKTTKVAVTGNAVVKEDCTICDTVPGAEIKGGEQAKAVRLAIGPDGKVIGYVDEDGYVRNAKGEIIGSINDVGLITDKDGNIIGVGENRRAVYDEFGNLIGYVNPKTVISLVVFCPTVRSLTWMAK